jgi:hypothetical protein
VKARLGETPVLPEYLDEAAMSRSDDPDAEEEEYYD